MKTTIERKNMGKIVKNGANNVGDILIFEDGEKEYVWNVNHGKRLMNLRRGRNREIFMKNGEYIEMAVYDDSYLPPSVLRFYYGNNRYNEFKEILDSSF